MIRNIKINLQIMFKQKTFWCCFLMMMIWSIGLPVYKAFRHWKQYTYELPSADSLYLASDGSKWWSYISLIIEIALLLPYCFSYMNQSKSGVKLYLQVRNNIKIYYFAQMITCFIGTFIAFSVPLLFNNMINFYLFPQNGNDYANGLCRERLTTVWINVIFGKQYMSPTYGNGLVLKDLFVNHIFCYLCIKAICAGIILGCFAVFFYGISLIIHKRAVWLMIIAYLVFRLFHVFDSLWKKQTFGAHYLNLKIMDYCSAGRYTAVGVYLPAIIIICILCISSSVCIMRWKIKKEADQD